MWPGGSAARRFRQRIPPSMSAARQRGSSVAEMPLLNYTSKVPAHESIAEISRLLAKAGARQIMHDYDDAGNIEALIFSLELEGQRIGLRLLTDMKPLKVLLQDRLGT